MESVLESQKIQTASITPALSIFLPTTSPLFGGLMLRVHPVRPAELLLPNPLGAGVLVAPPDRLDDFGFVPSAFDRVMIRRSIALKPARVNDVRDNVLAVALSGFAGREARVIARETGAIEACRQHTLRNQIATTFFRRGAASDLPDWLVSALIQTGLNPLHAVSVFRRPSGPKSGAGGQERVTALAARVPPRLALLRKVIGGLPEILPGDYNGSSAGRCVRLAEHALSQIEGFYAGVADYLLTPGRLTGLIPARNPFAAELGILAGWVRFCLMAQEIRHAPCRAHAVADLAALAQVLGHKNSAGKYDAPGVGAVRPVLSGWPREIDYVTYLSERNERMLRTEIALDARIV
ncbi:hypothetical protein [Acetobacter oeni]|uniref:Uncharacterized protein n=1 Tax=Acetobacter oeni TaxID=304077 RepID=A0A511XJU7_9PROT|nr:hypothetical protein [Acetobacter oeni]MBB3883450.1 hypothetical protein [Acetobacter oeni]NHO19420.1 hypothetical protein [Acetobacter oeni]GBR04046.1 hypothetical protein AA21952_1279 [Acetobacter oeni LMG 21952]GEN63230.1 hypothetical protein AOE01nite_14540 [Acetobacter oeni]